MIVPSLRLKERQLIGHAFLRWVIRVQEGEQKHTGTFELPVCIISANAPLATNIFHHFTG